MRAVHITSSDLGGGAGKACIRLCESLRANRIDARALVGIKYSVHEWVDSPFGSPVIDKISARIGQLTDYYAGPGVFCASGPRIANHPWLRNADIVNFHNLHGGYMDWRSVKRISAERRIVWTVHDMWPLTGHCAVEAYYECDLWCTGCRICPNKSATPAVRRDWSGNRWRAKRSYLATSQVNVVAPSAWLADRWRSWSGLSVAQVHHVANGVDTTVFSPRSKEKMRAFLGLDPDAPVLMVAAANLADPLKGGLLVRDIIIAIRRSLGRRFTFLMAGAGPPTTALLDLDIECVALGPVTSDRLLAGCYSAADVFALTSLAENLPNALLESMAAGTVPVAFAVGGVPEIVSNPQVGLLADRGDTAGFAALVATLLRDRPRAKDMGLGAAEYVAKNYSLATQATRYSYLYERILSGAKGPIE